MGVFCLALLIFLSSTFSYLPVFFPEISSFFSLFLYGSLSLSCFCLQRLDNKSVMRAACSHMALVLATMRVNVCCHMALVLAVTWVYVIFQFLDDICKCFTIFKTWQWKVRRRSKGLPFLNVCVRLFCMYMFYLRGKKWTANENCFCSLWLLSSWYNGDG